MSRRLGKLISGADDGLIPFIKNFLPQKANVGVTTAAKRHLGLLLERCGGAQCWCLGVLDMFTEAWIVQGELRRK